MPGQPPGHTASTISSHSCAHLQWEKSASNVYIEGHRYKTLHRQLYSYILAKNV